MFKYGDKCPKIPDKMRMDTPSALVFLRVLAKTQKDSLVRRAIICFMNEYALWPGKKYLMAQRVYRRHYRIKRSFPIRYKRTINSLETGRNVTFDGTTC